MRLSGLFPEPQANLPSHSSKFCFQSPPLDPVMDRRLWLGLLGRECHELPAHGSTGKMPVRLSGRMPEPQANLPSHSSKFCFQSPPLDPVMDRRLWIGLLCHELPAIPH